VNQKGYWSIKDFRRFQHYSKRNPPWIKLYTSLLEDYDFIALSDAAKLHLVLLWLLASRMDNRIPDDRRWLARAIHANGPVRLDELVRAGFLVPAAAQCEQDASNDASNSLADRKQDATPEGEAETETETTPPPLCDPDEVRSNLPERYRGALDQVLTRVVVPASLIATLNAMNSGLDPPPYTWEEIGLGLHDLVANGKHVQFNARQLRRYVAGAREQLQPKQQAIAAPGDAAQAFEDAMRFLRSIPGGYMHVTSEKLAEVPSNVQRAVRAAGGWKELANADEIGLRMRRKQFIEAFTASAA